MGNKFVNWAGFLFGVFSHAPLITALWVWLCATYCIHYTAFACLPAAEVFKPRCVTSIGSLLSLNPVTPMSQWTCWVLLTSFCLLGLTEGSPFPWDCTGTWGIGDQSHEFWPFSEGRRGMKAGLASETDVQSFFLKSVACSCLFSSISHNSLSMVPCE